MFFLSPNSFAKEFMLFSGLPWRGVYKICLAKAQGFQDCAQGSLGWGGGALGVAALRFLCLALCAIFLREVPPAERILQWWLGEEGQLSLQGNRRGKRQVPHLFSNP